MYKIYYVQKFDLYPRQIYKGLEKVYLASDVKNHLDIINKYDLDLKIVTKQRDDYYERWIKASAKLAKIEAKYESAKEGLMRSATSHALSKDIATEYFAKLNCD